MKKKNIPSDLNSERRKFISTLTKTIGASVLLSNPLMSFAGSAGTTTKPVTVGEIMDLFIKEIPNAPFAETVDTLKSGSRDTVVTGVLTTAFATIENIRKAIDIGANFIIVHEPTFYYHSDETNWLMNDEVYKYKAELLRKHNIAVWRNHDYIHSHNPDGIMEAVTEALGWKKYNVGEDSEFELPTLSLKALIDDLKKKLGAETVRYVGNLDQTCKKVLLMPGASGGPSHIKAIGKFKPDVILVGEANEWETVEYVRDANAKGQKLGLVLLGHIPSEDIGSKWMASWLNKNLPGLRVTYVPTSRSIKFR